MMSMATDITPEFGCALTGEWWTPYEMTFRLAGGDESPNYNLNDWKLPGV
jgi:hypothetical protein